MKRRRQEVLSLFEEHVYGRIPPKPSDMTFEVYSTDTNALGGKATRKQVEVLFSADMWDWAGLRPERVDSRTGEQ